MTFPAVLLGVHAYHITQVRPVMAAVAAAACGMTAAVPAYFYAMSLPQSFSAIALLKVLQGLNKMYNLKSGVITSARMNRCSILTLMVRRQM